MTKLEQHLYKKLFLKNDVYLIDIERYWMMTIKKYFEKVVFKNNIIKNKNKRFKYGYIIDDKVTVGFIKFDDDHDCGYFMTQEVFSGAVIKHSEVINDVNKELKSYD